MPGVPSGRGCDACRKQKKKCDTAQPACARCARLRIPCTGNGQRRFKFIQVEDGTATKSTSSSPPSNVVVGHGRPAAALSSSVTRLASSFASGLEVKDPRFDLACYGPFLSELPKRFGTHEALDASASALICAYPAVHNRQPTCEALTKYGKALQVLRLSLETPNIEKLVEVLCAIYFLLICQTWIARPGDEIISHGRAVSQMLNAVAGKIPTHYLKEGFEHQVLVSMCIVVIIEATFDPTIQLHPWYRENLMAHHGIPQPCTGPSRPKNHSSGQSQGSITVETLARIPDLVHAPQSHAGEIRDLYERACIDAADLAVKKAVILERLTTGSFASPPTTAIAVERIIPSLLVAQSILLSVALGCNAILSVLAPWDASLAEESTQLYKSTMALAQEVAPYRPLAASHFPLCLMACYLGVTEPEEKKAVQDLLVDFQRDFATASWLEVATKARESYWTARVAYIDDYEHRLAHDHGKAGGSFEGEAMSFCAVQ